MNILQVCIRYPPAQGGAEKHTFQLAHHLNRLGHSVNVFTTDLLRFDQKSLFRIENENPNAKSLDVPVKRFHTIFNLKGYPITPSIINALLSAKPDIIHTHSYAYFPTLAAHFIGRLRGIPIIFTSHGLHAFQNRTILSTYDKIIGRWSLSVPRKIIAISRFDAYWYSKLYVPREKIVVVPSCLLWEDYTDVYRDSSFRKTFGISEDSFLILFVGRIDKVKGLQFLIHALYTLIDQNPQTRLLIVGPDFGMEQYCRRLASNIGVSQHIIWAGTLNGEKLQQAYLNCDVCVIPSLFEPMGRVPAEALAYGKPVVVSDVGGMRDIVEHGCTGLRVSPERPDKLASAIGSMMEKPEWAEEMAQRGRLFIEQNYTWKNNINKILEVYQEAIRMNS